MAKIMICDDAAFMRMMIKDILTKNGYEIVADPNLTYKAVKLPMYEGVGIATNDDGVVYSGTASNKKIFTQSYINGYRFYDYFELFNGYTELDFIYQSGTDKNQVFVPSTGFKYIGEQMLKFEKTGCNNYVFGMEESYGCLPGTYARDKDAPAAVCMLCEVAAFYKKQGKTLWDGMIDLYEK